jgi:hypothetical protein
MYTGVTPSRTIRVPLGINCARSTVRGLAWAKQHGYCLPRAQNRAIPRGTVNGDCGWASIRIDNLAPNPGQARVQEALGSYWGPMIFINYRVYWYNAATTGSGQFGQAFPYGGGSFWANTDLPYTGAGGVSVEMLGYAVLAIGVTCNILDPADANDIT